MSPARRVPIVGPRWLPSPGPVGLKASDAGSRPRLVFAWGQRSALSSHGSLFSCLARTRAAWGVFFLVVHCHPDWVPGLACLLSARSRSMTESGKDPGPGRSWLDLFLCLTSNDEGGMVE